MFSGRGGSILLAGLLTTLVLGPMATAGPRDPSHPMESITLRIGGLDEMKVRNVLAPIAWEDPHTMAVLARVYDTPIQRDPKTGEVVPRLAVGMDGDGDGRLDPAEVGDFSHTVGQTDLTVFYDFGAARFHDGVSVSAWDVLFSYHILALHPMTDGPLRVVMDAAGGLGSNFTASRWLHVLPVDDGDGNASTAALRFARQFPYVNFATRTLGIPILPLHVWSRTGGGRHADTGCAIWMPSVEATARGVPECGNGDPSRWGVGVSPTDPVPGSKPFDLFAAMSWNVADADVIGSGHFRFTSWSPGLETRLAANPDYAFGPPQVDEVRFLVYRTQSLLVLALRSGEIDLALKSIGPEFHPDLRSTPGVGLVEVHDAYPLALYFNARRMPFGYDAYPPPDRQADPGHVLRRAVAHLVDRRAILTNLLQDHGRIADSMVHPENSPWHNASVPVYPFDIAAATAILDSPEGQSAGIGPDPPGACDRSNPGGCRSLPWFGNAVFEILVPQADYDAVLATAGVMVGVAMNQVGLNALPRYTSWGQLLSQAMAHDFYLFLAAIPDHRAIDPWTLLREDPDYLFETFHASNAAAARNLAGFWDAEFDSAADASRLEMDFMPRDWHVHHAQGVLAERLPAIPVAYANWTWAFRFDRFAGWQLAGGTIFNYWTLQGLDLSPPPVPGPVISLLSPPDGSVIRPGRVIDLEVQDTDLVAAEFSLDAGAVQPLPTPWDVDTTFWAEGPHVLGVAATDAAGNTGTASFSFTIDSVPPAISLESPQDGAVVRGGEMDFDVVDPHLAAATITIDGGALGPLAAPFQVSLAGLADGARAFEVGATDLAGNTAAATYTVTLDTVAPTVRLVGPTSGSLLGARRTIDFDVEDLHLSVASVRADDGNFRPLAVPYDVVFEDLLPEGIGPVQGPHTVEVLATDAAGNTAAVVATFTLDTIAPVVVERAPIGTARIAPSIHVRFSEPVNRTSVESGFSLSDGSRTWTASGGTFAWTEDGRAFTFALGDPLTPGRSHEVRVRGSLTDIAGNPMGPDATWSFVPQEAAVFSSVGAYAILLVAVLIAAFFVIALVLVIRRRKKGPTQPKVP